MFGELLETYGSGLIATIDRQKVDPFAAVKPVLDEGDFNIVNLECVLSDESELDPPFSRILISPTRYLRFLTDNRINVVNTANNHALDHGVPAFERSCDLLRSHGIAIMGYDQGNWFQEEPVIRHADGQSIGFLGYNISNFPARDREYVVERITGAVKRTRSAVDLVVVSIHWGEEYTHIPPPYVVGYGKRLLEAGCDIIHGHHSHQVQGIHNDGRRLFAPSLGNFIFDQKVRDNRITAVLQVNTEGGRLAHRYLPYRMNDRFQPMPTPELAGYLAQLDGFLRKSLDATGSGAFDELISRRVRAGHNRNRVRMRLLMPSHFWDYLPHARAILGFRQSTRKMFSVVDCLASLPDGGNGAPRG